MWYHGLIIPFINVYQREKIGANRIHPTTMCLTAPSTVCVIILLPMNIFGLVQSNIKGSISGIKKMTNSDLGMMTQGVRAPASGKT